MVFFKNKSTTLIELKKVIKKAKILPQFPINHGKWKSLKGSGKDKIVDDIFKKIPSGEGMIARSSCGKEDSKTHSAAGAYKTILDIKDKAALKEAIQEVFQSFGKKVVAGDICFIQPMLKNVSISGVIFTRDPNNDAPYYIINYDDKSHNTTSVTGGSSNDLKTFVKHRLYKSTKKYGDFRDRLFDLVIELEKVTRSEKLDIEFAVDNKNKLYLFQVRPLIINSKRKITDSQHFKNCINIYDKILSNSVKHPHISGKKPIYGTMPDWNPAEIIGVRPRPLTVSLYREAITDVIWSYQRDNYGYKNLRSFPLMVEFGGMPYIDVRVDFNSFIPKSISDELSEKLVNFYLEKLKNNPHFHDKVEFEIVLSCFDFCIDERIQELKDNGFKKSEAEELKLSLLNLTKKIIDHNSLYSSDKKKIELLDEQYNKICDSDLDLLSKCYWLLEDCKRYGTLPFAGVARAGFIAISLLRSMVRKNILTDEEYHDFLGSLNTVGSQIVRDKKALNQKDFIKKYGHLRPGTYDITSPRYDEKPGLYFKSDIDGIQQEDYTSKGFSISSLKMQAIENLLVENGFDINVSEFFEFIKDAIEQREFAKFIFTRSISKFLSLLSEFGKQQGFTPYDISCIRVKDLMLLNTTTSDIKSQISILKEIGELDYDFVRSINLPTLIINAEEVFEFFEMSSEPNFITQNKVNAEVIVLDKVVRGSKKSINGKIILIESADPGFDWIFSHKILGLVTKYGGRNSHMAIRSAELQIPAIIGAGKMYDLWKGRKNLSIDCLSKIVA